MRYITMLQHQEPTLSLFYSHRKHQHFMGVHAANEKALFRCSKSANFAPRHVFVIEGERRGRKRALFGPILVSAFTFAKAKRRAGRTKIDGANFFPVCRL